MYSHVCMALALLAQLVSPQIKAAEGEYPDYMDASSAQARKGYDLLSKGLLPVSPLVGRMTDKLFDSLYMVWPEALQAQLAAESDPAKRQALGRKLGFERYGYYESPFQQGVPLGSYVDKKGNWEFTCTACHAGLTPQGQMYIGMPNRFLNLQTLVEDFGVFLQVVLPKFPVELQDQLIEPAQKARVLEAFQFFQILDPKGERILNQNRGVTDVWYQGMINILVRDQEMNPLAPEAMVARLFAQLVGKAKSVDMDPRPWWHMSVKGKTHLYADGWAPKTGKSAQIAGLPLQNSASPDYVYSAEQVKQHEAKEYQEVMAYLQSLKPPRYKQNFRGDIDRKLTLEARERGSKVYAQSCARCHGDHDAEGNNLSYPNKWVAQENIGTDPDRLTGTLPNDFRAIALDSWFGKDNALPGKEGIILDSAKGYVAPPLTGLWASAPYFHNGSVPTLYHVLHPEERPSLWRALDGFDKRAVGLNILAGEGVRLELDAALAQAQAEEIKYGLPPGLRQNQVRREYYNADKKVGGKSKEGHEGPFARLSEEQKSDLLEYLKTF